MRVFYVFAIAIIGCTSNSTSSNSSNQQKIDSTITTPESSVEESIYTTSEYQREFTFFKESSDLIKEKFNHPIGSLFYWNYIGAEDAPTGALRWKIVFNNERDFSFEGSMTEEGGTLQIKGEGSFIGNTNSAKGIGEMSAFDDAGDKIDCNERDSIAFIFTDKRLYVQLMYLNGDMDKNEVICEVSPRHGLDGIFTRRKTDME